MTSYKPREITKTLVESLGNIPVVVLSGKEPITIDEAQKYPEILNVIKKEVDRNRKPGKF